MKFESYTNFCQENLFESHFFNQPQDKNSTISENSISLNRNSPVSANTLVIECKAKKKKLLSSQKPVFSDTQALFP